MNETKFTKGEWKVFEYGRPHYKDPNLPHVTIHCCDGLEQIVDTVYELADAYLIAEAPELYAFIESRIPFMNTVSAKKAEALLAKARGEL